MKFCHVISRPEEIPTLYLVFLAIVLDLLVGIYFCFLVSCLPDFTITFDDLSISINHAESGWKEL